jgi:hypothetical protein
MSFSLVKLKHRNDFGDDWYIQIINTGRHFPRPFRKKSLLQVSLSWNDDTSWPYLQIISGGGTLFGMIFWVYKFGFDMNIWSRTWTWEHLRKLENETV